MAQLQDISDLVTQTLVAERIYVMASEACPEVELLCRRGSLSSFVDEAFRSLVITLDTYVHGMVKERIVVHRKWPKTWWDAFKQRWFPAWAKGRWPVEWERVDIDQKIFLAVCPHIHDRPQETHLTWMAAEFNKVR